jgi:CBS domain-containing protein
MNAGELMVQPVVTVRRDTSLAEAARLLLGHRIGCLPVVDDSGLLCGIITESDFAAKERGVPFSILRLPQVLNEWMPPEGVERVYRAAATTTVGDVMSSHTFSVLEDAPIEQAMRLMLDHDIGHVPVVRDGTPVGLISRHDLLRMMVVAQDDPQPTRV